MKHIIRFTLAALCFALAAEEPELIRNGSFETESRGFAADWNVSRQLLTEGLVALDRQKAAAGKNSLRLTKSDVKGTVTCTQEVPVPRKSGGCKLDVRLKVCAVKAKNGQLVVITWNAEKKRLQWIQLFKFSGTFDFKEFRQTVELDPAAAFVTVSCRAPQPGGILWVDDVSLKLIESAAVKLDFEGEKSSVAGLPEPWREKKYHGNENVSTVSIVKDDGRLVAVQKYTTGGPLSGFSAPLPPELIRQKYISLSCPFRFI